METRKLGRQGLEVAALGLGCMGMTGILQDRGRRCRVRGNPDRGSRSRGDAVRHRRSLRAVHQRGAARAGPRRLPARQSRAGHQVRLRPEPRPPAPAGGWTAVRSTSVRSSSSACAGSGPTGSTCCTSTGWTRRCRSRTSSGPWRSSSGPARCATWGCRRPVPRPCDGPTPCTRSAPSSPNIPFSNEGLSARCCPPAANSASAWCPIVRSAAASWPASGPGPRSIPRGITGAVTRGCRRAISTPTCGCWKSWKAWRYGPGQPPARSRSPGCWPRVPDIVPIFGTTRRTRLRENLAATSSPAGLLRPVPARPGLCAGQRRRRALPAGRHGDPRPRPLTGAPLPAGRPGPRPSGRAPAHGLKSGESFNTNNFSCILRPPTRRRGRALPSCLEGAHRHDRPAAVSVRRLLVVLRRLHGVRAVRARAGPGRVSPRRARSQRARSRDVERGVGAARARLQLPLLPLHALAPAAGACARRPRSRETRGRFLAGVPGRLRRRESARRRQRLRVRGGVLVLRGAGQVPAPRAVLRHPRRAAVPRAVHLARFGADAVPLDRDRVRRVPDR